MTVDPATSKFRAEHDGAVFHFCSARCQSKFIAEPTLTIENKIGTMLPCNVVVQELDPHRGAGAGPSSDRSRRYRSGRIHAGNR